MFSFEHTGIKILKHANNYFKILSLITVTGRFILNLCIIYKHVHTCINIRYLSNSCEIVGVFFCVMLHVKLSSHAKQEYFLFFKIYKVLESYKVN